MRTEHDELVLRWLWLELGKRLKERSLPDLRQVLDGDPTEFYKQDPQLSYATGWSVFQLLMSTPENRRVLNALVAEFQKPALKPPDCVRLLDKSYPGGLVKLDQDWRVWIARGAANVLRTQ